MAIDTEWSRRLSKAIPSLTRREREFASFVNNFPHEAAFMSLREAAEKSGISRPKIIDFFRKLGFDNFQEFQSSVQNFYKQHINSYKASTITFKKIKSLSELVDSAVKIETKALSRMRDNIKEEELDEIAENILSAKKVFIFGPGTGYYPAHYINTRLKRYKIDVHLISEDMKHIAEELYPMGKDDLLIVFNYFDRTKLFNRVMSWGKDLGCRIIMVTEQFYPKLINIADRVFYIDRGDIEFKNSMALPMTFANLILLAVEMKGKDTIEEYLKTLEKRRETFKLSDF